MADITKQQSGFNDAILLKLAREIAMDMRTVEEILETHKVTAAQWDAIKGTALFQNYLQQCVLEWQSAINTQERVKVKAMAFVEEALPEFYARAHDPNENLNAKVEVLKTVARFAGVGGSVDGGVVGEKFSITINLGADHQLRIEKDVTPRGIEEPRT